MKSFRNFLTGIFSALLVSILVIGALSISLAEGRLTIAPADTPTSMPVPSSTIVVMINAPTDQPGAATATTSVKPSATPLIITTAPAPTTCPAPAGWVAYTIQPGDTIDSLAITHMVSAQQIATSNCLISMSIMPGTYIFLPPVAFTATNTLQPVTSTPVPCGPPRGWVHYTVRPGDTLFGLSIDFGVSIAKLQQANCMGTSTLIISGQQLHVPNVPTRTPTTRPVQKTATPTWTKTATLRPTITNTKTFTPYPTSSFTPVPSGTTTYTPVPATSTLTATPTPTLTETPTPSATFTDSPTLTPSQTPSPTPFTETPTPNTTGTGTP